MPADCPQTEAIILPGATEAAARVELLVLDVDGVCTDGKLYMNENGQALKSFYVHDGIGMKTALKAGLHLAVITGRNDKSVEARMTQLGVLHYYPGYDNKLPVLMELCAKIGIPPTRAAYLGDDWIDLGPMSAVSLPAAVANARPEVKAAAIYVSAAKGGEGAVREFIEFIMRCRNPHQDPASYWLFE